MAVVCYGMAKDPSYKSRAISARSGDTCKVASAVSDASSAVAPMIVGHKYDSSSVALCSDADVALTSASIHLVTSSVETANYVAIAVADDTKYR